MGCPSEAPTPPQVHDHIVSTALSPEERLGQLKNLKEAGLLSPQEHARKRREILKEL